MLVRMRRIASRPDSVDYPGPIGFVDGCIGVWRREAAPGKLFTASRRYSVAAASTRDVAPNERVDYWTAVVNTFHGRMVCEFPRREDFSGTAVRQRTETYQVLEWISDEVRYHRTRRCISSFPDGDYRLVFPTAGNMILRGHGNVIHLGPGSAVVTTMAEQFELWQSPRSTALIMTLPCHDIELRLPSANFRSTEVDLTTGLGRVISMMIGGLVHEREHLNGQQFDEICYRLTELLCMAVQGDDRPTSPAHLSEVEAAIRRYVRAHAADSQLDGRTIANALGWSVRQIQLALQQSGTTPHRLIKEERLRLAMYRLRSPEHSHHTVTQIASQLGFSSLSSFSTAFRERFGSSPSSFRDT